MTLQPIGVIHSPFRAAEGTPIQPRGAVGVEGTVEVLPTFEAGLKDLEGFDRIWLIYWCDRAGFGEHKLLVTPYLDCVAHGVFATRAPARPNPIGISTVRLLQVCGNIVRVSDLDILDGTPLVDIKPYVPQFDSYEVKRCGWLKGATVERKFADARFDADRTK